MVASVIFSIKKWGTGILLAFSLFPAQATVYQSNEAFLSAAFEGEPPSPTFIWLRGEIKKSVRQILGHPYAGLRIRYWSKRQRTAWILEEIGKERPITTGIIIEHGAIKHIRVLAFRESRGGEVRHDFFTRQFLETKLNSDNKLDRHIDSITGATLSVNALKRLARLALYLDGEVRNER